MVASKSRMARVYRVILDVRTFSECSRNVGVWNETLRQLVEYFLKHADILE